VSQIENAQKREFQGRLDRIQSTRAMLLLNLNLNLMKPRLDPIEEASLHLAKNAIYPLSLIGAFLLGMFSVVLGQFVRVNLIGVGQPDELWLGIADLIMATMIIFSIKSMFHLPLKELVTAQTFGIILMFSTLHNLVLLAPFPFAILMSPEWVQGIQDAAHLGTLRIGTMEIPFMGLSGGPKV
jgi:hypothetical protein